jgi:hypothetical protein
MNTLICEKCGGRKYDISGYLYAPPRVYGSTAVNPIPAAKCIGCNTLYYIDKLKGEFVEMSEEEAKNFYMWTGM